MMAGAWRCDNITPFVKVTKPSLVLLLLIMYTAATGFGLSLQLQLIGWADAIALVIYGITLPIILHFVVSTKDDCIVLDLQHPVSLFACFYLFYYFVTGWLTVIAGSTARSHSAEISIMVLVSFLCFVVGARLSGYRRNERDDYRLEERTTRSLLRICLIGAGLIAWYYAWKVSIGQFYTHGGWYVQEKTIFASLMQNAVEPMELPIILAFGLVMRQRPESNSIRRVFYFYVTAALLVYALSSQFRAGLSALLFAIASINISQRRPVRLRTYVVASALAGIMLMAILAIRAQTVSDGNQFEGAVSALFKSSHEDSGVRSVTFERMLNQPNFLSLIMERVSEGYPFLHGDLLWSAGYMLVPRIFWPAKPTVTPMQLLLRFQFGLPIQDDAPGPMVEFYANGGWFVVVVGFLSIGWIAGRLTKRAAQKPTLGVLLVLVWWWSLVTFMEQEFVLMMLAALRTIALIAVLAWLIQLFTGRSARYYGKGMLAGVVLPFAWLAVTIAGRRVKAQTD